VKKWLIILVLLAASAQGGEFKVGDSVHHSSFAQYRYAPHMSMTSSGGVIWVYCVDKTTDSMRVYTTLDMGTTLDTTNTFPSSGSLISPYTGAYSYGESTFVSTARASADYFSIAKFSGALYTRTLVDTVAYTGYSGPAGTPVFGFSLYGASGGQMLVAHREETGTTDSMRVNYSSGALSQTTSWTSSDSSDAAMGGQYVDFYWNGGTYGGILAYVFSENDLDWIDVANGFDTLSTAFLSYSPGSFQTTYWNFVQKKDSFGLVAFQQSATAGTDNLYSMNFKVSGVGGGSGTVVRIDSALIESHAGIASGFSCNPYYSVVGTNGDTVRLYYLYWADTTNADSADIVYKQSTDGGVTWGSRTTYVAAVNTRQRWALHAPPRIYKRGNYLLHGVSWLDSVATRDTLWTYLDSTYIPPSGPTFLTGVHHSKAGMMPAHSKSYIGTMHRK